MKKSYEGGKLRMILFGLAVIVISCGLSVYAASQATNRNFTTRYRSSTGGNNMLTAQDWNNLMDSLNEWTVPEGAIMAFEGGCPDGWTDYNTANGKFILGSDVSGVLGVGGSSEVMLSPKQLPKHSHYIRYGNTKNNFGDNSKTRAVVVDWNSKEFPWNPEDSSDHGMSLTDSYSFYDVATAPYGREMGEGVYHQAVNIMNPYVKLHYCIKGAQKQSFPCNNDPGDGNFRKGASTTSTAGKSWTRVNDTKGYNLLACEYNCALGYMYKNNKCVKISPYGCCSADRTPLCYDGYQGPINNYYCDVTMNEVGQPDWDVISHCDNTPGPKYAYCEDTTPLP